MAPAKIVGRERDLEQVANLLARSRLLTLSGAGGIGKSLLARAAVARIPTNEGGAGASPTGTVDAPARRRVYVVDLDSTAGAGDLPRAVLASLGPTGARNHNSPAGVENVAARLAGAKATFLLDGCDHLLDACAALVDAIGRRCPAVRVLATAREPLGVAGETVWRTPPLEIPAVDDAPPDAVAQVASVRLFIQRARLVAPDFAVTERNARAVARLCRALDGLPLAIELAAAALRMFTVEQVADHPEAILSLPPFSARVRPARHWSLGAVCEWSYRALPSAEQALFQRLAEFAGDFSLEAAAAVGGCTVATASATLAGLVDRSMVVPFERSGVVRYRLLEPVRWYAAAQLAAREAAGARDAHLRYFVGFAERAARAIIGPSQSIWYARIDADLENLRAALARATNEMPDGTPDTASPGTRKEAGLRLAAALGRYWHVRGLAAEGKQWLARALARSGADAPPAARAMALAWLGGLARDEGRPEEALPFLEAAVPAARQSGDASALALALRQLGRTLDQLELAGAKDALEEAGAVARASGLRFELAHALLYLAGHLAHRGDPEAARRRYEEALEVGRRDGAASAVAFACLGLGHVLWAAGDTTSAEVLFHEGLAVTTRLGFTRAVAHHALGLIGIALQRGASDVASRLQEALRAVRVAGHGPLLAAGLVDASRLALERGDPTVAARVLAAAAAWRPHDTVEARDGLYRWLLPPQALAGGAAGGTSELSAGPEAAALRAALDADMLARAWTEGSLLTLDAAAQEALDWLSSPQAAAPAEGDALTAREREIAALVARGCGTREIAATLVISVGTVRTHVERILKKLDLHSRVQLTAWALRHLPEARTE